MGSLDLFGFLPFGLLDLVDILLVAFLLYKLYELIRGTIAIRIFFGVLSIYLLWMVVTALQMEMMSQIFRQFINVGVIALIIVFQQEIRRFLIAIGNSGFFRNIGDRGGLWTWLGKDSTAGPLGLAPLAEAVFNLAASNTGALIVLEREADIQNIIDNGKRIQAEVSAAMLESIFFKNSPLHDGAVVIRENQIVAASCTLPLSAKRKLPSHFGMRHKAALGATEELDVIVILVSEETGEVSIAHDGKIESIDHKTEFKEKLQKISG